MGFLTVVVLSNDARHVFEKHPKEFGEELLKGVGRASMEGREISVPFHGHANYLNIHPPRHADATTVFLFSGNSLSNLSPYDPDFKRLIVSNPKLAEEMICEAEDKLKRLRREFREIKKAKKAKGE